jgi:hypothetical protein
MTEPTKPDQATIDALATRLVQLAASPDEAAARAELAGLTGQIPALKDLQIAAFTVPAIVAYILMLIEKLEHALPLALADARAHGPNQLTGYVINQARLVFLRSAFVAVHAKRPDIVRAELTPAMAGLQGTVDLDVERGTLDLLSHVDTINVTRAGLRPLAGRPTLVKIGVWGPRFIESAGRTVFSSLLASGNAPALKEFGPAILHIHTRRRDVEQLRALDSLRALEEHLQIEIEILPEELFFRIPEELLPVPGSMNAIWNRRLLALVEYDSLMYARQIGADMVCLGADIILSEGLLKSAKDRLAAGHEIVFLSPPRVADQPISAALASYRHGAALNVPADVLYRLSLEHLHPSAYQQFMCRTPRRMPADPHQFFFVRPGGGFAAHAIQWYPLAFSARSVAEDIGFDAHTIDCRFAADLTRGKDRSAVCWLQRNPPEGGYLVSLDRTEGIADFGSREVSPQGVAGSLSGWISTEDDFEFFKWVVQHAAVFDLPPGVNLELPQDCLHEDQAITDLIAAIEPHRAAIMGRVRRYAR